MNFFYTTEHLEFRILQKNHADKVLDFYLRNKESLEPHEFDRCPNFYTLAFQEQNLTAEYNLMNDSRQIRYWLFLKGRASELVGSVSLQNIVRGSFQSCQLGYKIGSEYCRQGLGSEAVSLAIDLAFRELNLHRMEAFVLPDNVASLALLRKFHFAYEGTSHACVKMNNHWVDLDRYALLADSLSVI